MYECVYTCVCMYVCMYVCVFVCMYVFFCKVGCRSVTWGELPLATSPLVSRGPGGASAAPSPGFKAFKKYRVPADSATGAFGGAPYGASKAVKGVPK